MMVGLETDGEPEKGGDYVDAFVDSTQWNALRYRDGDIVVASPAKAGTTLIEWPRSTRQARGCAAERALLRPIVAGFSVSRKVRKPEAVRRVCGW